jgi:hypothetical protein
MADFRALASNLGTREGALLTASEIASVTDRLSAATFSAEQLDELITARKGLERLDFVLRHLYEAVKYRVAELEEVRAQKQRRS